MVKLNQEIVSILSLPDVRESFARHGLEPVGSTPDEFAAHIKSELAKWSRMFKEAGLRSEELR